MSSHVATPRVCAVTYEDGSTELPPFHEARDRIAKAAGGDDTAISARSSMHRPKYIVHLAGVSLLSE